MILKMENTLFYSQGDERNLFRSLSELNFIVEVFGVASVLNLNCIFKDMITADDFLTVYSIFKRYDADCSQLSSIVDYVIEKERGYIKGKNMIWYHDIFD
jgi:hypothetical protein